MKDRERDGLPIPAFVVFLILGPSWARPFGSTGVSKEDQVPI
jgi:hypothetical protein